METASINHYEQGRESCQTIAKKIRVVRKVANKLQAVKDKVERASADKDNRVASKVAANKASKRAASRPANLNQQRREMRLDRSYLALLFSFLSIEVNAGNRTTMSADRLTWQCA
jgi:hypothetical protein